MSAERSGPCVKGREAGEGRLKCGGAVRVGMASREGRPCVKGRGQGRVGGQGEGRGRATRAVGWLA